MEKTDILAKLFSESKQLPTLPTLYMEFNKIINSAFPSAQKVAELVKKDQAMVVKILKLCNSPMYGKLKEVTNIIEAISFLGLENLRQLILQIALVRMFRPTNPLIPEFKIATMWEHSIATAHFATVLANKLKLPNNDSFYMGGLLHDIGKLLIYQFYPRQFEQIVLLQIEDDIPDYQAEAKILGVNHAEIGGFLTDKWKLQREISRTIEYHHHDLPSQVSLVTAIVAVANQCAHMAGLAFPWEKKTANIADNIGWLVLSENVQNLMPVEDLLLLFSQESDHVKTAVADLLSAG
jgi:putative nucleotidyltransferase with HDIG domain